MKFEQERYEALANEVLELRMERKAIVDRISHEVRVYLDNTDKLREAEARLDVELDKLRPRVVDWTDEAEELVRTIGMRLPRV